MALFSDTLFILGTRLALTTASWDARRYNFGPRNLGLMLTRQAGILTPCMILVDRRSVYAAIQFCFKRAGFAVVDVSLLLYTDVADD